MLCALHSKNAGEGLAETFKLLLQSAEAATVEDIGLHTRTHMAKLPTTAQHTKGQSSNSTDAFALRQRHWVVQPHPRLPKANRINKTQKTNGDEKLVRLLTAAEDFGTFPWVGDADDLLGLHRGPVAGALP